MGNGRSSSNSNRSSLIQRHRGANKNDTEDAANTMADKIDPWLPPGSFFRVDLTLMDVSGDTNDDPDGKDLLRIIRGGIWETACCAGTFLKQQPPKTTFSASIEEAGDVRKRVSRFLKTNDKYLAFASMLFKSRFFHEVYYYYSEPPIDSVGSKNTNTRIEKQRQRRPVVQLPTTKYRKPYIPLPSGWRKDSNHLAKEEDIFSFSVSHQFPFVGFARIHHNYQTSINKGSSSSSSSNNNNNSFVIKSQAISGTMPPPIVGLDIVVFDKINPRLYSSEEEFLDVFRDQFTSDEWENSIQQQSSATIRLREFYVRWAMKEAYTKAIGVGMGLEFKSFEIRLEEGTDEDNAASDASIWSRIIRKNQEEISETTTTTIPVCFKGTIVFSNNENEDEYFYFYFLPLESNTTNIDPMEGCACVCVGSFRGRNSADDENDDDEKWKSYIDISWTDIEGLVQLHQNQ